MEEITRKVVKISDRLWELKGNWIQFLKCDYPLKSYIKRLKTGDLWIYSPVQPNPQIFHQVKELLGKNEKVAYLVSPCLLHHLFISAWKHEFQDAKIVGPSDITSRLKKYNFKLDLVLDNMTIPEDWKDVIDFSFFSGSRWMSETIFHLKENKTIIVTDFIQRHDLNDPHYSFISKIALRLDGITGINGGMPRDYKMTYYWPFGKRDLARQAYQKVLTWEFDQILLAHGMNVETEAKNYFKKRLNIFA